MYRYSDTPPASLIVKFIYLFEESHYFAFKPPMGGGDVGSIRGFMLFDHYQNLAFMFVAWSGQCREII